MEDRYELHKKLQDMSSRAAVSVNSLKAMHLVSYTTVYDFLKNPELARSRTLSSVRLIVEFLECACKARLLPVRRATLEEIGKTKEYYVGELYDKWWDNNKKFTGYLTAMGTPELPNNTMSPDEVAPDTEPEVARVLQVIESDTTLESDIETILGEVQQDSSGE